jgi:hypothetical protein
MPTTLALLPQRYNSYKCRILAAPVGSRDQATDKPTDVRKLLTDNPSCGWHIAACGCAIGAGSARHCTSNEAARPATNMKSFPCLFSVSYLLVASGLCA